MLYKSLSSSTSFSADSSGESSYTLNHVAVEDLNEGSWWQNLLGYQHILNSIAEWDPIVNDSLSTMHFYKSPEFYLTLREELPEGVHHMGWEAKGMDSLDKVRTVIEDIGWPILWEGEIDKSYVLHFEGPDRRVHDFFCTSNELRDLERRL